MSEVTKILAAAADGDPTAARELLPLVYDELRQLASHKMAREQPGQTLDATALVHEAYLRLVGSDARPNGITEDISSLRPQRRCAVSWWKTLAEKRV